MTGHDQRPVHRWLRGADSAAEDAVAEEVAVALSYNRRSHVVMMATPDQLEDLALGFSLTEGIVQEVAELLATRVLPRDGGLELSMTIGHKAQGRLEGQRRNLTGRTGCGLCGAESLGQAIRFPRAVGARLRLTHEALQAALGGLDGLQPLKGATGAVHGAAWCSREGAVAMVREDVGRHNALDKLIGALARAGTDPTDGFLLVSSRASYEMVYKSATWGAEALLAVSAPTTLAIEMAAHCGLTLVGFARPGRHNVYTHPQRISPDDGDHE